MGRKPLFVAEAPASICCSEEVKKKKEGRFKHCHSLWRLLGSFPLADVLRWSCRREERLRTKEEVALVFVSAVFHTEAPAWRGWSGSFVAAQRAPKSMLQTPRRIFKGALGNIFPAPSYKMTTIYYSCRAWWSCWSISVTQQLLCQRLSTFTLSVIWRHFQFFQVQQWERTLRLHCVNTVSTPFSWEVLKVQGLFTELGGMEYNIRNCINTRKYDFLLPVTTPTGLNLI